MKGAYLYGLLLLLPTIVPAQSDEQIAGIERHVRVRRHGVLPKASSAGLFRCRW